jgi:hypothetical protein
MKRQLLSCGAEPGEARISMLIIDQSTGNLYVRHGMLCNALEIYTNGLQSHFGLPRGVADFK